MGSYYWTAREVLNCSFKPDGGAAARNKNRERRSGFGGTLMSSVLNVLSCMGSQEIAKGRVRIETRKTESSREEFRKPETVLKET